MKFNILFLSCLSMLLLFSACDNEEDLTSNLVGDYIGAYVSPTNPGNTSFEVTVKRIDNASVTIEPKSGSDFNLFEIELERSNSSTLLARFSTEPGDDVIIFTESIPIGLVFTLDPLGSITNFTGQKQ